jgi:hypothetical protein
VVQAQKHTLWEDGTDSSADSSDASIMGILT